MKCLLKLNSLDEVVHIDVISTVKVHGCVVSIISLLPPGRQEFFDLLDLLKRQDTLQSCIELADFEVLALEFSEVELPQSTEHLRDAARMFKDFLLWCLRRTLFLINKEWIQLGVLLILDIHLW